MKWKLRFLLIYIMIACFKYLVNQRTGQNPVERPSAKYSGRDSKKSKTAERKKWKKDINFWDKIDYNVIIPSLNIIR